MSTSRWTCPCRSAGRRRPLCIERSVSSCNQCRQTCPRDARRRHDPIRRVHVFVYAGVDGDGFPADMAARRASGPRTWG